VRCLGLLGALSICACGTEFDHVGYEPFGAVPSGVSLEPTLVSVPQGVSVAARITAVKDYGNAMPCEPTLTSDDDTVMTVELADRGSTVFTGVSVGETGIVVHCSAGDGVIEGRVTKN
jgi:hypothetical protein